MGLQAGSSCCVNLESACKFVKGGNSNKIVPFNVNDRFHAIELGGPRNHDDLKQQNKNPNLD